MREITVKTMHSLSELGSLQYRTQETERNILNSAMRRLEEIYPLIERARPGVESASELAKDRYLELIKERGQLQIVVAKARANLGLMY